MTCNGNEKGLAERLIAGDDLAWDFVYKEYSPKLVTICRSYVGNNGILEDLVQTTWLKFIKRLPCFDFGKGISVVLYEIARNNCKDYLRHKNAVKHTSLTGLSDKEGQYYNIDISDAGMIWDAYKPKRETRKRKNYNEGRRIQRTDA